MTMAGDDDQLKHYWTKTAEGLAKWATHAHPWTALYHHLVKHMPAAMAKRVTSQWFKDVFGIWPGEREGKNPLGPRGAHMSDLSARALLTGEQERRVYPAQFEVKAAPDGTGGTKYSLRGYATVYDLPYDMYDKHGEYRERVRPGAGKKTLSEHPDVVLRMDHVGIPLARTKNRSLLLSEDSTGLDSFAPQLNGARSDIHNVVTAVEDGILDEMSFAFRTTRQRWSDAYDERDIDEYSLHRGDVSVVTFGANPNTSVALRAQDFDVMDEDSARALYERLQRRFNPPKPQRSLALIKALAEVQG